MSLKYHKKVSGGAFGEVWSGSINDSNEIVAVKKIDFAKSFDDTYKRIFREIEILEYLNSEYSIRLLSVHEEKIYEMTNICLVLPFIEYDLRKIMREFEMQLHQKFQVIYQILLALQYLYHSGILHRDLKPSNVGLDKKMNLKLLDFGLAREKDDDMTNYVVTRYYRPIDVFCSVNYSTSVDMWSAGCIFAELFTKEILFKGDGQIDQVKKIIAVVGYPDPDMLIHMNENSRSGLELFKGFAAPFNKLEECIKEKINLYIAKEQITIPSFYSNLMELLIRCIEINPFKRATPEEALSLPIFNGFTDILQHYKADNKPDQYKCTNLRGKNDNEIQDMIYSKIQKHSTSLK